MKGNIISRRTFLTGTGVTLVVLSGIHFPAAHAATAGIKVPNSTGTEPPSINVPPNATDCHQHIYDSRFPMYPGATFWPGEATVADYRLLQKRLGITRNVTVAALSTMLAFLQDVLLWINLAGDYQSTLSYYPTGNSLYKAVV